MTNPNIVLQTDFGLNTGLVCSMYGVIKMVDRNINIYDLNHQVREYDFRQASNHLGSTIRFWPTGTIFVSVVDPGVGTPRRACAAKLKNGSIIITPDNGTLTIPDELYGIESVREIDETVNRLKGSEKSHTFHGRDLFAYTAAKLAAGIIAFTGVGPEYPVSEIVRFETEKAVVLTGKVECTLLSALRQFGNLNLSVETDDFEKSGIVHGDTVHVTITKNGKKLFDEDALYHKSFGFADIGAPIVFNGSNGTMGMGLNQRSFADKYLPGVFDASTLYSDYRITLVKK